MTKEEKIKEAWGELPIKILNKVIKNNGWLNYGYACNGWDDVEDYLSGVGCNSNRDNYNIVSDQCDNGDLIGVQIIPKSLQGIENNNGWIKIESEEDLPKEKGRFWVVLTLFEKPIIQVRTYPIEMFSEEKNKDFWLNYISYYQLIEKPNFPIY